MRIEQLHLAEGSPRVPVARDPEANRLVLAFGSVDALAQPGLVSHLGAAFPGALLLGCSTAGEITPDGVSDGGVRLTALTFEATTLRAARALVPTMDSSHRAGRALAESLIAPGLSYVLVLSDGVHVNGSALVKGLIEVLGTEVTLTGGLAGDGGRFTRTLVLDGAGVAERMVAAVGFYGGRLRVGHASIGGWESFGPIKTVTRSRDNVVFEMDGRPALSVYESYLGDEARNLPASGLLFPLALVSEDQREIGLIRTLLAVDRETGSLTFAGNVPQGGLVRLMHASFDRLAQAAGVAAADVRDRIGTDGGTLAVLISCVGRRLLMGENTDEEVEAASAKLGRGVCITGFYSNGEISPFVPSARCELHNQTMTITTLAECR